VPFMSLTVKSCEELCCSHVRFFFFFFFDFVYAINVKIKPCFQVLNGMPMINAIFLARENLGSKLVL
jgi:hypothetical protein